MTTESSDLVRLEKAHIKPAAFMLARAFKNDPINAYAYPDAREKDARLPYQYDFLLRYGLRYGEAYATSPKLEGIAVWLPPRKVFMSFWRLILSGTIPPMLKMGREVRRKMKSFWEYAEAKHNEIMHFPHWYLQILAVDPEFQGKGYASKLLRGMLVKIDKEGLPCYLETENERHVSMYKHFGFKVIEEFVVPGTAVILWAMLKDEAKIDRELFSPPSR